MEVRGREGAVEGVDVGRGTPTTGSGNPAEEAEEEEEEVP